VGRWRVKLFDGPVLEGPHGEIRRFRSRKVGAILAYLALKLDHPVPRDEIAGAVWPDEDDQDAVANRFRVALASLRKQLEPPEAGYGSVIDSPVAGCLRLRADAVSCDAVDFENALKAKDSQQAQELYTGPLMPGYDEEWLVLERYRFEALAEGLTRQPRTTPAPQKTPAPTQQTFLPQYLTRFFGRENEQEELAKLIQNHRLVTVTGPGGMGKTRLTVEVARQMEGQSVFVALAAIDENGSVPQAILSALGISPSATLDLLDQLKQVLSAAPPTLFVLDNIEHVVEAASATAQHLLERLPHIKILATGRMPLEIPGEQLFLLSPLEGSPPVALFIDRAQNARPDFVAKDQNLKAIEEICELVNRMPLGIELAAARVVAQTPIQIQETLAASILDLKSRQRGLSERHRSIKAPIQGSYDQLPDPLKDFFAALSTFKGGWTAEAAGYIAQAQQTQDLLEELVLRSLVLARTEAKTIRYGFLEPIRQFAEDLPYQNNLQERHREYFLNLAAEVDADDINTLYAPDADQENLMFALRPDLADSSELYANGLRGALVYAHARGRQRAFLPFAELALQLAPKIQDLRLRTELRVAAYFLFSYSGQLEVIIRIAKDISDDCRQANFKPGLVHGLIITGYSEFQRGNQMQGIQSARESLALARETGEQVLVWRALRIAGFIIQATPRYMTLPPQEASELIKESEQYCLECLATLPAASSFQSFERMTLVQIYKAQNRLAEYYAALKAAQRHALEHQMSPMLMFALSEERDFAISREQLETASLLHGSYFQLRQKTGYLEIIESDRTDKTRALLTGKIGEQRFNELFQQGMQLSSDEIARINSFPELAPHDPGNRDQEG
jgi:predicted ATPase/DNA-binding winged helix-turn-helix (wHTH) protein